MINRIAREALISAGVAGVLFVLACAGLHHMMHGRCV